MEDVLPSGVPCGMKRGEEAPSAMVLLSLLLGRKGGRENREEISKKGFACHVEADQSIKTRLACESTLVGKHVSCHPRSCQQLTTIAAVESACLVNVHPAIVRGTITVPINTYRYGRQRENLAPSTIHSTSNLGGPGSCHPGCREPKTRLFARENNASRPTRILD